MKEKIRFEELSLVRCIDGKEITILDGLTATICEGEIYTVIGPSGSGKSSLLRMINRLEERSGGSIYLDGKSIDEYDVLSLRRRYGLVFQIPALFPVTVEENVLYSFFLRGEKPPNRRERALELIRLVGLEQDLVERDVRTLSVGQQQRVAFARVLANEPEALLLDEPTSALDPTATLKIEELIKSLNRELNLTIIFITHMMEQAKRIGERTMFLKDGKKVSEGKTADFFSENNEELLKDFINGKMK
jgi:putative ABC transport system ATP-binding protein